MSDLHDATPTPTIDGMIREYCEDFGDALAEVVALVEKKEEASTLSLIHI